MNKPSVLQQLYVDRGQFIINNPSEKITQEQPKYHMDFILPMLIGMLTCGVALSSILTLYIDQQSCTSESTTTTVSTTISTTPTTSQTTQMNQTNSSVATTPYYCSGVSSYTLWELYINKGIMMNVNTSSCNFNSTPFYFTSLAGDTQHWDLGGYNAIYGATKNSFTIFACSLTGMNNTVSLSLTQTHQWNINWFGIVKIK